MSTDAEKLKHIVEAALLAAARPLSLDQLQALFSEEEKPDKSSLREALRNLEADYADRSVELREVASGFRVQVRQEYSEWTSRLWEERPTRYSRALLETLALVAYRQPVTRGEIEEVRGVSVSSNIVKTLMDRNWIRIVGHRDVPGRPAMFGTTRDFLDYFGLKSLDELPTLAELRDIDSINVELDFDGPQQAGVTPAGDDGDDQETGESALEEDATATADEETEHAGQETSGDREPAQNADAEPEQREEAASEESRAEDAFDEDDAEFGESAYEQDPAEEDEEDRTYG